MRKLFLLPFLLVLLACESDEPRSGGNGNIVGSWRFERMANTIDVRDKTLYDDLSRWMDSGMDFRNSTLTFNADGTFNEVFASSYTDRGVYSIVNGLLIMHYLAEVEPEKPTVYIIDGNNLTFIFDHTAIYRAQFPNAGVSSIIERRCYTLR